MDRGGLGPIEAPEASLERTGAVGQTGMRLAYAAKVKEMVLLAKDAAREVLAEPGNVKEFCRQVMEGVKLRSRTEMRLYPELMGMVGQERTLVVEFVNSLGVRGGESELRRIVDSVRSAEGADTLTALERMTTAMEAILPLHEEHRAMVIRRLGGYLPYDSNAEVSHVVRSGDEVDSGRVPADWETTPGA